MFLPEIKQKVASLSRPDIYPVPTHRVETKETHMSWVFLTDTHAYKLKKPVRYDFLDFSTIEARRRNCEEEVRLNRRLAQNVYCGTVPLTITSQGNLQLAGEGEIVDWLVKMRRLPADRMLDYAIACRTVSETDVRQVGALLTGFYKQAPAARIAPTDYRRYLTDDICSSQKELAKPNYFIPIDMLDSITTAQLNYLEQKPEIFDDRVRAGKIIEAHGDLRPEHICLEKPPVIIDCLEFNRDFRILDVASELAYLSLECERLGARGVGNLIFQIYSEATGDKPPIQLHRFYKSYHACLRAKIAVWHLKDQELVNPEKWPAKWIEKAKHYLWLATCIATEAD